MTLAFLTLVRFRTKTSTVESGYRKRAMLCFLCGKKIGFLRSLIDQQYCCSDHRKEARLASTQVLREEEDHELWAVSRSRQRSATGWAKTAASAGQTASIFAFLTVGALLIAALLLPSPGPGNAFPAVSLDNGVKKGFLTRIGDSIGEAVRSRSPITLQQSFPAGGSIASGPTDWVSVNVRGGSVGVDDPRDWIGKGKNSIASLRLWKRSTSLQNYQMEFQAELKQTSLNWAFRAMDGSNHYATSIAISRPGPLPNASLERYVMLNGREYDRVQFPLPVTLERGGDYRVRVTVQDNRYITYLNGNVISSWTDDRLKRGGIGFFDERGDPQVVKWVRLSERDSFLGRLIGHFALFVFPEEPEW